jgi:HSP20 family protein
MSEDYIRIMHAFFLPAAESCRESLWSPAADVYRERHGWLVKFELAGVRLEDLELSVRGRELTLRGIRRDLTALEGCRYYQLEVAYGHFERRLTLPRDLDQADIAVEYHNGMLLVHIPDGGYNRDIER